MILDDVRNSKLCRTTWWFALALSIALLLIGVYATFLWLGYWSLLVGAIWVSSYVLHYYTVELVQERARTSQINRILNN